MDTKVATVTEVLRVSPEIMHELEISELERYLTILEGSTTKAAQNKAYLISEIVKGKQKNARKPEPIANSAKTVTPKDTGAAGKAAAAKGAAAKRKPPTPKPVTAATTPPPPTSTPVPPSASKPAGAKPKKPEDMTQAELLAELKKNEKFPDVVPGSTEDLEFIKLDLQNVDELCAMLASSPYEIYMLMDERFDDNLTLFLVTYASDKVIITVDKNREPETFLALDPISITTLTHEEKEGNKVKFTMSLAFYKQQVKA